MSPERRHALAHVIIRGAAVLVPGGLRDEWRREWNAELAALGDVPIRYRRPIKRSLGAFADAFWLRQRSVADFDWIDDLRHGWRQLVEHRGFAVMAVGILSIGLAATVTMFSVTDQILLRPLPYPDSDRIVTLWEARADERELMDVSPGNFLDWRERTRSFAYISGVDPWSMEFTGGSRPEVLVAGKATAGFFESFGVKPVLGRFFTAEEYQKGRDKVIVLHEGFWRQRFGGDPSIVGQALPFEDGPHVVVGVVPNSFEPRLLPRAGQRNVWLPKALEGYEQNSRSSGYWNVVGLLKPGISLEAAQAELTTISQQLATEYPRTNRTTGARVLPLREHLVGDVRLAVRLLGGAVTLVLLIACVNVANLLLARGSARERELAIRVALGARRARIVRQLLTESLLIAAIGGALGVLLAYWALIGLSRFGPPAVPWIDTLHLDGRAVAFAGGVSIVVALLAGTLPAIRAARTGLASAGRGTSTADPTQHRVRAALVVVEVALALVLVLGAGLLIRSFTNLMGVDPGFQRERVMVVQVFAQDHNPTAAQLRTFFDNVIARLQSLPAVQSVGTVSAMPFIESNINIQANFAVVGQPPPASGEEMRGYVTVATSGYFDAMRIPLRHGRFLADRDGPDAPRVVVVSDDLARRRFANREPIGERLSFRFLGRPVEAEIVGVTASLRHERLDLAAREEIFVPFAQSPFGSMTFVVRTAGAPASLIEPAKAAIWSVNPLQTLYRVATLDELVQRTVSPRRFALAVLIAFAGVALLLAIAGVYGVLSAIMTARLREVGLRVALGASHWDIVRLVLGRGLAMAGVGLAIGLAASLAAAQLLRSFLFETTPADPMAIAVSAVVMTLAALAACYLPARRAASADPVTVLRAE